MVKHTELEDGIVEKNWRSAEAWLHRKDLLPQKTKCPNCGQPLDKFPVKGPNQRCPTKEEIKQGHYN